MKKVNKLIMIEKIKELIRSNEKINIKGISRELDIDRKTVRKYWNILNENPNIKSSDIKRKYDKPAKDFLLSIKDVIDDRIEACKNKQNGTKSSIYSIYEYLIITLQKTLKMTEDELKSKMSYSTLKSFIKEKYDYPPKSTKDKNVFKESYPGKVVEIDWAENVVIYTEKEGKLKINILEVKLSFSRYIKLFISYEKSAQTLLKMVIFALIKMQGCPQYLVCDNMKSIIAKNQNFLHKKPILEKHWQNFTRDFGIEITPCHPFSPEQKGKVESDIRIAKKIKVWSGKIKDKNHLIEVLQIIEDRYNSKLNGVGIVPIDAFLQVEKQFLQKLPNKKIIETYLHSKETRLVNNDYKIAFLSNFYYVSPRYLNQYVQIYQKNSNVYIEHNGNIIATYPNEIRVWKHNFTTFETHLEILKFEFAKRGDDIPEETIKRMAKETVESLDIQYKLKVQNHKNWRK